MYKLVGMDIAALQKKIKLLEIKSKMLTNHLFSGEYHSAFKGRGMLFKEVKEYAVGDDIRFIDWNVSARLGNTYTKVFEEERELCVYLLADASASMLVGSQNLSKRELMIELCAVLAFSAQSNNDKTGLLLCTSTVEKYIPANKGKNHVLYLLRELVSFQPQNKNTDLVKALQLLHKTARQKSIVFIVSDFADAGYENALRVLAKHHDVIGIQLYDPIDTQLPNLGLVQLQDAETGNTLWVDMGNEAVRKHYTQQYNRMTADAQAAFRLAGAQLLPIATTQDYVQLLQSFFLKR